MIQVKFKERFTQHKHTFKKKSKNFATTLSAYTWNKGSDLEPDIECEIIQKCKCKTYQPGNFNCDLCLSQKLHIIKNANNSNTINKRNDIATKCAKTSEFTLDKIQILILLHFHFFNEYPTMYFTSVQIFFIIYLYFH